MLFSGGTAVSQSRSKAGAKGEKEESATSEKVDDKNNKQLGFGNKRAMAGTGKKSKATSTPKPDAPDKEAVAVASQSASPQPLEFISRCQFDSDYRQWNCGPMSTERSPHEAISMQTVSRPLTVVLLQPKKARALGRGGTQRIRCQ